MDCATAVGFRAGFTASGFLGRAAFFAETGTEAGFVAEGDNHSGRGRVLMKALAVAFVEATCWSRGRADDGFCALPLRATDRFAARPIIAIARVPFPHARLLVARRTMWKDI